MAYRQSDSFSRPNDTYQSIRDQLERETSALIQERNVLNVQRPSNTYFPTYRHVQGSPRSKISHQHYPRGSSYPIDPTKKAEIKHKIKEIIDLCRDQNAAVTRDVNDVMETQRGIYNLLNQAEITQTRPPPDLQGPVAPIPYTPIRAHEETIHPGKALQKDIRSIIEQNRHIQLSEEALQLIEEIERRSLAEIQKLRDEKLSVIAQLNEEIRRNNADKKRIAELQRELDFARKNQGAIGDPRIENELRSKVIYLENLLQQQQSAKPGDFPDFALLYAQGEAIRQDTLRLLKLKEAKVHGDDEQKRRLREEVSRLQRRVEQMQQQRTATRGKPSYEVINQEYSPIAPSLKRKDSHRNSANQYESLVMEMRKITAN